MIIGLGFRGLGRFGYKKKKNILISARALALNP